MNSKRVAIKNHTAEANLFARRAFFTLIGVIILLLVLFNNVYQLQVNSFEQYKTRSNDNRIKLLPVAPNRGLIYDRNGVLLADNKPIYSLEIIPEQISDIDETLSRLTALLDISEEKVANFHKERKRNRRFKPVEILSRMSDQQVALFAVNQHKFKGVFVDARLKRYYPFADLTTHSLGYVAKINSRDLQKLDYEGKSENYAATRDIGKLGIEKYYQELLHGTIGHQEVEVNNQGRIIRTLNYTPPVSGKDITLSLDIELQMIAKRALTGRRGAVVALDPRTGEVLAMYSNPSYDGNLFVHGISSKDYRKLINSKDLPLINRTTQGRYPPASTVKPLLALRGLDEGIITPETRINDPGWYQLANVKRRFRDWKRIGHGWVDLTVAIEQSCDTYFWDLAYKMGIDSISESMAQFGFGERTGIDIYEETAATLPSRGWKRAKHNQPWYIGDTMSVGIGQGYWTVTPLQLAQATATLANRGIIRSPHLLKSINTLSSEDIANYTPYEIEELPPIVLNNPQHWDHILSSMHTTVQRKGAGAFPAFKGSHYDAAGKTGTAQVVSIAEGEKYDASKLKEQHRDNAMFIAFAPYEAPEIVVAVAVENVAKGGGGSNAAPIARQMLDQYFGNRTFGEITGERVFADNSTHNHQPATE